MNISILIFISCICLIFVLGKVFIVPIKWIVKLIINSIIGGLLIFLINFVGKMWAFHIGLNIWTAIIVRNSWNSWSSIFSDT